MRRLVILVVAGLALIRPAAAAGPDLAGVTLRVGIFQDVERAKIELSDLLKATPYKIEWARLNGAGPTILALGGGAIDLSWGLSDTAVPRASAEDKRPWAAADAPLKIIALMKPFDPERYGAYLIAAHRDAGIRTLADLRGKSYAFNEGGNSNARALLALDKAGLTRSDVQVRLLQSDSLAPALISGAVQAAAVYRVQIAPALEDGTVLQLATEQEAGFPGFVSVTARTEAIQDPRLGAAIADFLTRAAKFHNWANAHPEAIATAYVKTQQLTPAQALLAAHSESFVLIPVGADDPGLKAELALTDQLVKVGFLRRPIDFTALVDARFSAAINAGNQQR